MNVCGFLAPRSYPTTIQRCLQPKIGTKHRFLIADPQLPVVSNMIILFIYEALSIKMNLTAEDDYVNKPREAFIFQ